MTSATEPCSTLEQRWSACRARVRGEEMVRDFVYCNLWKPHLTREEALQWFAPLERRGWHSRPCTSPRRHQCRNGAAGWVHRWVIDWERCEELPW
jgi:hypothetical protein